MQYRRRVYKQPELARIYNCNVTLYEERACEGQVCGLGDPMRSDFYMGMQERPAYQQRAECQLSAWGPWSLCSVTCGEGYQTRQRQYLSPEAEIKCQSVHQIELRDTRRCAGATCLGNLPGEDTDNQYEGQQQYEPQPENESPFGDRNKLFAFPVGNLKGNQWGQDDEQLSMPRQQTFNQRTYQSNRNQATDYRQIPRLQDSERAAYQRNPSENYNVDEAHFSGQRQNNANRDITAESESDPFQRPINNYNNYGRGYDINSNVPEIDLSKRCFQMLQTTPLCRNETIMGNFWFYNYCTNECMIFAVDPCDRNVNKFNRLEACEECRRPEFQQLQERASKTQECRVIIQSRQAEQQFWKEERRRNNYNGRRG